MSKPNHPFAFGAAVFGGVFMVLQAKLNGQLGHSIGNGVLAAEVSFGSGLLLIGLVMVFRKSTKGEIQNLKTSLDQKLISPWALLAGGIGGFFVITQGVTVAVIGISVFTLSVVTGQALSAVIIDTFGLVGMTARTLTLARAFGAGLAGFGLVLANYQPEVQLSWLALLPLLAGIGIGFQQALNGGIGKAAGSPLLATLINFTVGVVFIGLVLAFTFQAGESVAWPTNPLLYLGGAIGVAFIFTQVVVVRIIGVLGMAVAILFGQLAGSLLLEVFLPLPGQQLDFSEVLAICLVGIGALLVIQKKITGEDA